MTDTQALRDLLAKVEAGKLEAHANRITLTPGWAFGGQTV